MRWPQCTKSSSSTNTAVCGRRGTRRCGRQARAWVRVLQIRWRSGSTPSRSRPQPTAACEGELSRPIRPPPPLPTPIHEPAATAPPLRTRPRSNLLSLRCTKIPVAERPPERRTVHKDRTPGGPEYRKLAQSMAVRLARSTARRCAGSQSTRGRYFGCRRVNSCRPARSAGWIPPVLTSIAHDPQLPSSTPSTSKGSSRQCSGAKTRSLAASVRGLRRLSG
jgi:hypothetical protein